MASEAETLAALTLAGQTSVNEALTEKKRQGMLADTRWRSLREFESTETGRPGGSGSDLAAPRVSTERPSGPLEDQTVEVGEQDGEDLTDSDELDDNNDSASESDESNDSNGSTDDVGDSVKLRRKSIRSVTTMGTAQIKHLLDRWEEPINKNDKTTDASISDILKFRKALSYMVGCE